jgi:hypothetical protein
MEKINQLIKEWKKGSIMLSSTLEEKGYNRVLLKKYVNSGWLESLGYGAYRLADDTVDWGSAIAALQKQKRSTIHPGGKTALIYQGYAHYLGTSIKRVDLFGNIPDKLPKWFKVMDWGVHISYIQTKLFDYDLLNYYKGIELNGVQVNMSWPELAVMEMLTLVPKAQSFDEAVKIMEGLTTLRPQIVQNLLEECHSFKVNRLFLFMAEKHDHAWLQEINMERINLGSGKRVIAEDGVLEKKYNITVPREYGG